MPNKLQFERPTNAPDVWREDDLYMYVTFPASNQFVYNKTFSERWLITKKVNLCKKLDSTFGKKLTHLQKKALRKTVLQEFYFDTLHATEIIDAYGLSE